MVKGLLFAYQSMTALCTLIKGAQCGIQLLQCRIKTQESLTKGLHVVICSDLLIIHNVVSAIAICVHLKINKPPHCSMAHEGERPWPYISKIFYYIYSILKD